MLSRLKSDSISQVSVGNLFKNPNLWAEFQMKLESQRLKNFCYYTQVHLRSWNKFVKNDKLIFIKTILIIKIGVIEFYCLWN